MFLFSNISNAGEITIPADFINDIAKAFEFKTDTNFIQSLLFKQIMKNSSINGVKLKDFRSENLMKYFNEDGIFEKTGSNKLVEPLTGAVLEFNSDGKCKKENCSIIVDLNGEKGPNELWTDPEDPKDRINFIIKRNKQNEILIHIPEFMN